MRIIVVFLGLCILGCNSTDNASSIVKPEIARHVETKKDSPVLKTGDLIFQTSRSSQSEAIQIATNSKYSHMGVLYASENGMLVFEAIQPVKFTKLKEWIDRGENGSYVVKRLKNSNQLLNDGGIEKLMSTGKQYLGKDYDLKFEWSDDRIYCSELVWKMYKEAFDVEIGALEKMKDFDLSDEIVQGKVKERYGNILPKEEWVITPDRMFTADNLIMIEER